MADKKYLVICSCCGATGGDRDRASGRCGNCGSFYVGDEEVAVDSGTQAAEIETDSVTLEIASEPEPALPVASSSPQASASQSEPDQAVEAEPAMDDSEDLIRPRRLSPQFKRHIEMTWQPALADGDMGVERTLSRSSPSEGTKRASSSLSIGTRQVTPVNDKGGGDYQLNEVIGEGSMGRVWSARQTSLDRNVAVKVPRAELAKTGSVGESQFISEVVVTGKLEHPNIVPIYELGRDTSGVPFYSMKHVQGHPWNELIREKTERENIEILMKVCDAIAFAHDRDFLHRDIKPHNVMVGEFGEVSVMDWGIAVSLSNDPTRSWAAVASGPAGTPAYMAPEMAAYNPSELGVVSDVYLLGAVLYEIVTGAPPHPRIGDTNEALLAAAANEIIPAGKSGELVDVARRAMATNPDDRYESVTAFQDALREYQSHRESIALSESADQHLERARAEGSSDQYARSRFAYEEALNLWSGNSHAANRLRAATIAHAQNALEQENYELGISILDPQEADHQELLGRLEKRRSAGRRLARVAKLAAAVALTAILSVVVVVVGAYLESQKQNSNLAASRDKLRETNVSLETAREKAEHAKEEANSEKVRAQSARTRALAAQQEERQAKILAQRAERSAEEASYASDIGFAAESIRRNAFAKATSILQGLSQTDSIRSKLRHIEWGLLQYASAPRPVVDLLTGERIEAVASSRRGGALAAGTEDGRVFVWLSSDPNDVAGERIMSEIRHGTRLRAIAMSDDGRYLASAGVDDLQIDIRKKFVVKIWDLAGGDLDRPLVSLKGHTAEVLSVVFSEDAAEVLTSAADRTAVVWDRATGKTLATVSDHLEKRVWDANFSPTDQRQIVTACDDGRVRVWQLSEGTDEAKKIEDFRGHDGPVYAAVFSGDGKRVFSGGYDRKLLQWQLRSNENDRGMKPQSNLRALIEGSRVEATEIELVGTEFQQHEASIRSISVGSLGGREYILTGANDNTVRIWEPVKEGWTLDKVLRGHGRWIQACVFSGSGSSVLSGAHDGLKLWQWQDYSMPRELYPISERRVGKESSELGLSAAAKATYSADGRWVATAYRNGTVAVWDVESSAQTPSQLLVDGHAFLTAEGSWYDDGKRLLTSAGDNTTRLWDANRGTQLQTLEGTGWRGAAAVKWRAQDATAWIVTGSDDRLVPAWLWKVKDGIPVSKEPLLEEFAQSILTQSSLARRTGRILATAQTPENDLDRLRQRKRSIPDVTAVAFSERGDRLLIGNAHGRCFLFQLEGETTAARLLASFVAHGSAVRTAAFLPSGESVITASVDGQLKQWGTDQGKLQRQLPSSGPVTSMAISDGGKRLLVGHSPVEGATVPVAQLINIEGPKGIVEAELSLANAEGTRDWRQNHPTTQSVRFSSNGRRAMISLFFPTGEVDSDDGDADSQLWAGYQLGYWDWQLDRQDFQRISTTATGEISSAAIRKDEHGSQLLVVGGKGARLLASDDRDEDNFARLTASFRPATSMTTIDFSYDQKTGSSNRMVAGDSEGNVRVWELLDGQWSESGGSAAHLTGHHAGPLLTTEFDPRDSDRMITADRSGKWIVWKYDQGWTTQQQHEPKSSSDRIHCLVCSPDGNRIFIGADDQVGANDYATMWHRNEAGQYQQGDLRWETGEVHSATFSTDGSWVVTANGESRVQFWNAKGQPLASLSEEDAKGLTTMDLSWDRRRFVTGHRDKRLVLWDTSKLVDTAAEDRDVSEKLIKVLLTLEEHRRGVTSVAISPDGRNLLSADEEGRTIISAGEPIVPISISLTHDKISHDPGSGEVKIDAWIALSDPSRLTDFSQAEFTVALEGQTITNESIRIGKTENTGQATIEMVIDDDGKRYLSYRPHRDADAVRIGEVLPPGDRRTKIRVALNPSADAAAVQAMLRTITYEISPQSSTITRDVSMVQPTGMDDLAGAVRELTVEISGIQYRDATLLSEENRASATIYPTTLRATIMLEVETDDSETDKKSSGEDETGVEGKGDPVVTDQMVGL